MNNFIKVNTNEGQVEYNLDFVKSIIKYDDEIAILTLVSHNSEQKITCKLFVEPKQILETETEPIVANPSPEGGKQKVK